MKCIPSTAEQVPFLLISDFPDFRNKRDVCVDSMIGWNNIEAGIPMSLGRPFVKIPVSVTDASRCKADLQMGQFCVKLMHKEQKINLVITYIIAGLKNHVKINNCYYNYNFHCRKTTAVLFCVKESLLE